MLLDNLKNMMEYFGIIDASEERNVENMLDALKDHF